MKEQSKMICYYAGVVMRRKRGKVASGLSAVGA